jgi:tungstate transport system ATP-binding protein
MKGEPACSPLFRLRELRFSYGNRTVLNIGELDFEEGEIQAVAGPNGSGKTTLLKILNGLLRPEEGELLYRGRPAGEEGYGAVRRQSVLVHQDPYLFDGTVSQNLAFALKIRRIPARTIRKRTAEKLVLVGLPEFEQRRARALSGGEKQRVAIARALVLEPRVLLLDEPTANVDPESVRLLERLIRRLAEAGTTIIFSSHHLAFAYRLCTRLIILEQGEVAPGPENVFKGEVQGSDERFTYFRTGARILRCPAQEGPFSTAVVPVEDVILSREKIHTSAQNQFLGTVTEVKKIDHTARVSLDCGFIIQALITTYSVKTLKVAPGRRFYVTFKAAAVRLY